MLLVSRPVSRLWVQGGHSPAGTKGRRPQTGGALLAHTRTERILDEVEAFIGRLPVPPPHRDLLLVHLEVARQQAEEFGRLPAAELPLLVYSATGGKEERAVPLAAACMAIYLGADLLDNLGDDEIPPAWRSRSPASASLAAATFLAALWAMALEALHERGVAPDRVSPLYPLFATGLLSMSAGQHADLEASRDASPATCRAVAEAKSGAQFGLYAEAAATMASDDPGRIQAYRGFGVALGTAAQLGSDLADIWTAQPSRDLLNGRPTLPVVHALTALQDGRRDLLRHSLAMARSSAEVHPAVRDLLREAGSLRYTALVVEAYRRRALAHLAAAEPLEPAGSALRGLVDEVSLLPRSSDSVPLK
jgi:geranylgeranyl diphosphate synthase type I